MGRIRRIFFGFAQVSLAVALVSCAAPGSYFGIDTSLPELESENDPARLQQIRDFETLLLIATSSGCFERTEAGLTPIRASQAKNFECVEILAEIESRGTALGLGRSLTGIASVDLSSLARRAQSGDKQAQLELGIRFEEGLGVERNTRNACALYNRAATQTGGTIWIYVPPVGNGTTGRVMPYDTGPVVPGLSEAAERRASLDAQGGC